MVDAAAGYVFVYMGRKVVISGDTKASPRLEAAAQGADVLVRATPGVLEALSRLLAAVSDR